MPIFDTSRDGIRELAESGESQTVEFKARIPPQEHIARTLASFANADGGILLIGVEDDGRIVGLPESDTKKSLARLRSVSESLFAWPTGIGAVDLAGKTVAYVVVDPAPRAYYPVSTSRGEFFIRVAEQSRRATTSELFPTVPPTTTTTPPPAQKVVAFVAMSFREEEEPALVDYFAAMKRAVAESGLPIELRRMDLVEGDYEISQKIMDKIKHAQIVVADFTLNARNVYFELGYARGVSRRVIQTARKGTSLEFDVRNWKTVFYRNATELEEKLVPEFKSTYYEPTGSS